jgi:hypothetical protein
VKKLLSSIIEKLNEVTSSHPNSFDINYRDVCKTTKTFWKEIEKRKEVVCACVSYGENRPLVGFSNSILNCLKPPPLDSIDLMIDLAEEHSFETLDLIVSEIAKTLKFDYGFIAKLLVTHDPTTERKIKRGWFGASISVSVSKNDHFYQNHIPAVKSGYLRSLYKYNFINDAHLKNTHIAALVKEGVGKTSRFNDSLTLWSLKNDEIPKAKEFLTRNKVILWSPEQPTPIQETSELDQSKVQR